MESAIEFNFSFALSVALLVAYLVLFHRSFNWVVKDSRTFNHGSWKYGLPALVVGLSGLILQLAVVVNDIMGQPISTSEFRPVIQAMRLLSATSLVLYVSALTIWVRRGNGQ